MDTTPTARPAGGALPSPGESVLYAGARLITGDGSTVVEDGGVVVRDGLIEHVGPMATVPPEPGRRTVVLTGRTVLPALVNPHGHIGYMCDGVADAAFYSRANVLDHLRRLAHYGVSTFQSLGTDRDDTEIHLRDEQRAGRLDEHDVARLFTAGAGIVAPTPGSTNGGPFFAVDAVHEATSPADARAHVRVLAEKRADTVKFWLDDRDGTKAKLAPAVYEAIIDEAHTNGLKVAAHIYTLDDAKAVLRAGADVLAHMPRHPGADEELLDLLTARDAVAFTSMSIQRPDGEGWLDDPALAESVSPAAIEDMRRRIRSSAPEPLFDTRRSYALMERTLGRYLEAGVRVVFSADTGLLTQIPGFAEHRELEALVAAGMPPLAAIRSATQRSADLLGLDDRGTLGAGKRADLLIVDGNPLQDITATRRIHTVLLAGRPVDRNRLRARWSGTG